MEGLLACFAKSQPGGAYVAHKKYNDALARKHLLDDQMAVRLLDGQNTLFALVSSISSILAEHEIKDVWVEVLGEADAVMDHAEATMSVIAAVGVREDVDSERADKAKKLVNEKAIPEALRRELKKLIIPE